MKSVLNVVLDVSALTLFDSSANASSCVRKLSFLYQSGEINISNEDQSRLLAGITEANRRGIPQNDTDVVYFPVVASADAPTPERLEELAGLREAALAKVISKAVVQPSRVSSLMSAEDRELEAKRTDSSYVEILIRYGCAGPQGQV